MLTDYIEPDEPLPVPTVNGAGMLAPDQSPVVVQVPDFGNRFWIDQIVDLRTGSFVSLGKMYGTMLGFYLLVGPNWQGEVPKGITKVFRASTNTANIIPHVFQDGTLEDKRAGQQVLGEIAADPLSEFDGTFKTNDWSKLPRIPATSSGDAETEWVVPKSFFETLPLALTDAPPLPNRTSSSMP